MQTPPTTNISLISPIQFQINNNNKLNFNRPPSPGRKESNRYIAASMGFNNPAFVDDDNKTPNTISSAEQNGKSESATANRNGAAHDAVNKLYTHIRSYAYNAAHVQIYTQVYVVLVILYALFFQ